MKFKGLKQFGKELSGIGRNKMLLISVIGVLMIPVMYSSMFLGAFWDPYGNLDKMPVAVVNADKGYEFNGEMMHIGDDFEAELKENEKFEWHFVSKGKPRREWKIIATIWPLRFLLISRRKQPL